MHTIQNHPNPKRRLQPLNRITIQRLTPSCRFLSATLVLSFTLAAPAHAQSFEVQQLILDVQKLAQMKNILNDLYKSYQVLDQGYSAIRDIAQGNFNLHKAFLDGLLAVSPAVRNDKKAADIVLLQARIVAESTAAWNRFQKEPHFTPQELDYLGRVIGQLAAESLEATGSLLLILTDGSLRMSDDERLTAIDGIHADTENQWDFLRSFTSTATTLAAQRTAEADDTRTLRQLYELDP